MIFKSYAITNYCILLLFLRLGKLQLLRLGYMSHTHRIMLLLSNTHLVYSVYRLNVPLYFYYFLMLFSLKRLLNILLSLYNE